MNGKALKAFENVKREAGIPYFSSLYDIDMWRSDLKAIEEGLKIPDVWNEDLFQFYLAGVVSFAEARKSLEQTFYMGLIRVVIAIYAKFNNLSEEETEQILTEKVAAQKKQKSDFNN